MPKDYVVALLPDTGMRYLSKVYNEEWMRERGYTESSMPITAEEVVNAKKAHGQSARVDDRAARTRPCFTR